MGISSTILWSIVSSSNARSRNVLQFIANLSDILRGILSHRLIVCFTKILQQVSSRAKSNRPSNIALTRTPLSEIFRGQTRSRLQKIGDQTTNNIEPFFTLHLNIEVRRILSMERNALYIALFLFSAFVSYRKSPPSKMP